MSISLSGCRESLKMSMNSRFSIRKPVPGVSELRARNDALPLLAGVICEKTIGWYRELIERRSDLFASEVRSELPGRLDHLANMVGLGRYAGATCTFAQMRALRAMIRTQLLVSPRTEPDSKWIESAKFLELYALSLRNGNQRTAFRPGQAQCKMRRIFWDEGDTYVSPGRELFRLLNPAASLTPQTEARLRELIKEERKPENSNRGDMAFYSGDLYRPWLPVVLAIHAHPTPIAANLDETLDYVLNVRGVTVSGLPSEGSTGRYKELVLSVALNLGGKSIRFVEWENWTQSTTGSSGIVFSGVFMPVLDNEVYDEAFSALEPSWFKNAIQDISEFQPGADGPSGTITLPQMNEGDKNKPQMVNGLI